MVNDTGGQNATLRRKREGYNALVAAGMRHYHSVVKHPPLTRAATAALVIRLGEPFVALRWVIEEAYGLARARRNDPTMPHTEAKRRLRCVTAAALLCINDDVDDLARALQDAESMLGGARGTTARVLHEALHSGDLVLEDVKTLWETSPRPTRANPWMGPTWRTLFAEVADAIDAEDDDLSYEIATNSKEGSNA